MGHVLLAKKAKLVVFNSFFLSIIAICIASVPSISLGETKPAQSIKDDNQNKRQLPIEDVQRFTAALHQIKNFYVEPVEDKELFEDAIRGMLHGLDPHSSYLDITEFEELKNHTTGEFGGLGIEVGMEDGYIRVISPIDDTPAKNAGIKAGDLIVRINGKPVQGMSLRDAVFEMRGKVNTDIDLTIIRKSEKKPLQFTITRDVIRIQSVKSRLLEDGYVYLRVSHFQEPSAEDLQKAYKKIQAESKTPIKGLVLDLRNNPGGLLDSAVNISDMFLDSGKLGENKLIVYTKGRIPNVQYQADAKPGDIANGVPMVVLINGGSASGSEIVAGALQDHHRAVIMGTPSFGKGSVQTVLPLDEKRGVKLTTALYYTPNGRTIQAKGIKPDIIVQDLDVTTDENRQDLAMAILKESDYDNHLADSKSPSKSDAENIQKNNKLKDKSKEPLAVQDYQLNEALNLLKGLNVVSNQKSS